MGRYRGLDVGAFVVGDTQMVPGDGVFQQLYQGQTIGAIGRGEVS
ncbi:hypothetical protein N9F34_03485 [Alphaproteobacteria bacterium]|nr:hypothetical protein [Alphaproteobacteria bacterium]